jgi:hypothetical protein
MAVRYAVATGNWSDTATWNGGTLPTSADDVFSNNFTVTIDVDVTVLSIRNTAQSPAVAGGGFVLNNGLTVTTGANGFIVGGVTLITYASTSGQESTLIGKVNQSTVILGSNVGILFSGAGTLNIIGDLIPWLNAQFSNKIPVQITGDGTLNIVGNLISGYNSPALRISGVNSITNITGNIGNANLNQTTNAQNVTIQQSAVSTLNITGTVYGGGGGTNGVIQVTAAATVVIIGNVFGGHNGGSALQTTANLYLQVIGTMNASMSTGFENPAIVSTNSSAINLFSGPFICGPYGAFPYQVTRMHLIPTTNSYVEFRDETTNGALPPAAAAPATRLVSPDTIVDSPLPSNVRHGVPYALGTFTGTLRVPSPNSVALGVLTDNTVGNAVLTPDAVWDYATANLTDPNSIGARLKNVSTVDTTGEQLEALL